VNHSNPFSTETQSLGNDSLLGAYSNTTRTLRIKKVGILSSAKLLGALYAVLGLIVAVVFALIAIVALGTGAGPRGRRLGDSRFADILRRYRLSRWRVRGFPLQRHRRLDRWNRAGSRSLGSSFEPTPTLGRDALLDRVGMDYDLTTVDKQRSPVVQVRRPMLFAFAFH
jgi:hypothetical protein